jgi:hypothetical protein
MANGEEGSSQGMRTEAVSDMAQMFQDMARQLVIAITNHRREAPRGEARLPI